MSTEGDAFTLAFHDPIDAVSWALESQHRLLMLPWPPELLRHQDAREQQTPPFVEGNDVVFRGLRVRMAMHTGQPDAIQVTQHASWGLSSRRHARAIFHKEKPLEPKASCFRLSGS